MADTTKIAVLDYSEQPSIDIIEVNSKMLNRFSGIEDYLIAHCGYNPSNIHWMDATNAVFNYNLTHDSFAGCDNNEDTYWDDTIGLRIFRNRQIANIFFDAVINGKKHQIDIDPDWDGTAWDDIHNHHGHFFTVQLDETLTVDCQIYADKDSELFAKAYSNGEEIDDIQIGNVFVTYHEEGDLQLDEIYIADNHIFGDNEEHKLSMDFYDGYAVENNEGNLAAVLGHPRILIYPTVEQAADSGWMLDDVCRYTGRHEVVPYDLALKFGKLYTEPEIMNF